MRIYDPSRNILADDTRGWRRRVEQKENESTEIFSGRYNEDIRDDVMVKGIYIVAQWVRYTRELFFFFSSLVEKATPY